MSRLSRGEDKVSPDVAVPGLLGTMAGGAADCQYWLRYLSQQCTLHGMFLESDTWMVSTDCG